MITLICFVLAFVLFCVAAYPRNLVAAGLAVWVFAEHLLPRMGG